MKTLSLVLLVSLVSIVPAWSQPLRTEIPADPDKNPWTHLNFLNDPTEFQFAIVSDRYSGMRPGVFESAVAKINKMRPEFIMSVGDFVTGYTTNQALIDSDWVEFQGIAATFAPPFFYTPGNHDLTNAQLAQKWDDLFGRKYYHFIYQNVLFLVLNSEDPHGQGIGAEQRAYISQTLSANTSVRWTFVFMHRPLWVGGDGGTTWPPVETLLGSRNYSVFAGHSHHYTKYVRNNHVYIDMATTGAGSNLLGPHAGEFDHFLWVTMTDEGPSISNLMLDGVMDENVVTQDMYPYMHPLYAGEAITAFPLFVPHGTFQGGTVPVQLKNTANLPMHVTGWFKTHEQMRPTPQSVDSLVAANATPTVNLALAPMQDTAADALKPIVLEWRASYTPQEGVEWAIEDRLTLPIVVTEPCPTRTAPPIIDGKLDDWPSLPYVVRDAAYLDSVDNLGYTGVNDVSFRFAIEQDSDYLYVAVEGSDDLAQYHSELQPWKQDGVVIRIDARPDPIRTNYQGGDVFTDFLIMGINPGAGTGTPYIAVPTLMPKGLKFQSVWTPTGHITEVAVPQAYLDSTQGGTWSKIRVNVSATDYDADSQLAVISWRTQWKRPESQPGSGTFTRQ